MVWSKQSISLLNVHTQSICAKKLEFHLMMEDVKSDITVACEIWLNPTDNWSEFMPSGYDPPLRKHWADDYGDVTIPIMNVLTAEQIMIPNEMVAVKIQTSKPSSHCSYLQTYK